MNEFHPERTTKNKSAPEQLLSERLALRRPNAYDACAIFEGWAADKEATRYMAWPRHTSLDDTREFLRFSDEHWQQHGVGPYLICLRETGAIIGTTGLLTLDSEVGGRLLSAEVGYILARPYWGHGYATETLRASIKLARKLGFGRLCAQVHPDNPASCKILEKCGFIRPAQPLSTCHYPNIQPPDDGPCVDYELRLQRRAAVVR
jgi:ribosomal-protein-alanine N-acetyltransferase